MPDIDLTRLVAGAQQGQPEAIGALYDHYQPLIFRYLWARVREVALAEDLTGEVFVRVVIALPRYRPTAAPFVAWLYRIAHNCLMDHYRKHGAEQNVPWETVENQMTLDPPLEWQVEHTLTLEQVHRTLAQIEPLQREVVTLRFLCGLSLQEVMAALNKTENAVKALQYRGLAAIRRGLAQEGR